MWMGRLPTITTDQAAHLAAGHDLILGHARTLRPHLATFRATNPAVRVLAYVNGSHAKPAAYPPDWYAHDAHGARCHWHPFGTDLLAPTERWADTLAAQARTIAGQGFDGAFLDSMGPGPVVSLGDRTGPPINPGTGAAYTRATWLAASATMIAHVRAEIGPDVLVAVNGLGNGPAYWHPDGPSSVITAGSDLAMIEGFVRPATAPPDRFAPVRAWRADVEMLADLDARNVAALAVTKVWAPADSGDVFRCRRYATATFLLGAGPSARFAFLSARTASAIFDPPFPVLFGAATGPYQAAGVGFVRAYEHGLVVVNPTGTPARIPVPGTYEHGTVTGTFPLGAHDGAFLRP